MSSLISLLRRKPNSLVCLTCGELEPVDDGNIESPFKDVCAAAKKGCESCSLLRHAIHDCLPQAVVEDVQNPVYVIVRRSILREFVEIAVRFGQGATIVVLDLFVSPSRSSRYQTIAYTYMRKTHFRPGKVCGLESRLLAILSPVPPFIWWKNGFPNVSTIMNLVAPSYALPYHHECWTCFPIVLISHCANPPAKMSDMPVFHIVGVIPKL
jgi:hypothetical protein